MNLLRVFFPGLGTKHVRVPNGNKNRSFTKRVRDGSTARDQRKI